MSGNSFGRHFKFSSFGESHGPALGALIDGCPAGVPYQEKILLENLSRRRPGLKPGTSARQESDQAEVLSGIYQGKSLGTPIAVIVRNKDARSEDYEEIKDKPRIGHADDMWLSKYGHSDHRGGGRSSGRETVARVIAGSFAQMFVQQLHPETQIQAFTQKIGPYQIEQWPSKFPISEEELFFPDPRRQEVQNFLIEAQAKGESYGGVAGLEILHPPKNLGQAVFHKLKSDFAMAMMSVGATTAFELGEGIGSSQIPGTQFHSSQASKVYGGIRGGFSTGESISMKIHFKPTSSVLDIAKKGRHDPCIVPRALPVLEAMAWLVLADHLLWRRLDIAQPNL